MMNEVLKVIEDRRSTRDYLERQVREDELQQIINAGILAPSARNNQKRHITVVQNMEILDEIAEKMLPLLPGRNDDYHVFHHAPTVLVLSQEKNGEFGVVDIGIMIQNMTLAAESLNIGTCILGLPHLLFNTEEGVELEKRLEIPENYKSVLWLSVGYSKFEEIEAKPRNYDVVNFIK